MPIKCQPFPSKTRKLNDSVHKPVPLDASRGLSSIFAFNKRKKVSHTTDDLTYYLKTLVAVTHDDPIVSPTNIVSQEKAERALKQHVKKEIIRSLAMTDIELLSFELKCLDCDPKREAIYKLCIERNSTDPGVVNGCAEVPRDLQTFQQSYQMS